ncbi:MAG: hypothetical protein OXK80_00675 [Bdellovibrionales bacterium]|nr:hypothetical protein [Bdellovibrionales bacterium]
MKKIKLILYFLPVFFFITNCSGSVAHPLTRESNRELLENPPRNQEQLHTGTYYGCVHIPATEFFQKLMVGFERTGESCEVTVHDNNNVEVSFIENPVTVVNTSTDQLQRDIFIGELEYDQVLIVQHHQGEVVSITQTIYDENGYVVYGKSGEGDYIKECHLGMTTSEQLAGRKNCGT